MSRIARALRVIRYRGIGYPWYLLSGVFWPRVVYRVVFQSDLFRGRSGRLILIAAAAVAVLGVGLMTLSSTLARLAGVGLVVLSVWVVWLFKWRFMAPFVPARDGTTSPDPITPLEWSEFLKDSSALEEILLKGKSTEDDEILLGSFDNDGRISSELVQFPGTTEISAEDFVPRYRFDLDLVASSGGVMVRKNYRGHRRAFRKEWRSLSALEGRLNSPQVNYVDERKTILYKTFVPGWTVRELLVEKGARILSAETESDPELSDASPGERIEKVWGRGRAYFSQALEEGFVTGLRGQVEEAHRCGVTGFSLTFGNVVVHHVTGRPWLIDFDSAVVHRSTDSMVFRRERDRDRELFNSIWGSSLVTERSVRDILRSPGSSYAPIDLGEGVVSRGFWSPDSGMGRWRVLNGEALKPLIQGKRILDLGSNNGVMSLMLIRDGAKEVIALERDPDYVSQARHMRSVFEWKDMHPYNVEFQQEDMRAVVSKDLGRFDLVSAFCSLYYLDEQDMERVARAVREIAPVFVVQAKIDTRAEAGEGKARKSSVEFLCDLLQTCGFREIRVIGPSGFSRPLIVAEAT